MIYGIFDALAFSDWSAEDERAMKINAEKCKKLIERIEYGMYDKVFGKVDKTIYHKYKATFRECFACYEQFLEGQSPQITADERKKYMAAYHEYREATNELLRWFTDKL